MRFCFVSYFVRFVAIRARDMVSLFHSLLSNSGIAHFFSTLSTLEIRWNCSVSYGFFLMLWQFGKYIHNTRIYHTSDDDDMGVWYFFHSSRVKTLPITQVIYIWLNRIKIKIYDRICQHTLLKCELKKIFNLCLSVIALKLIDFCMRNVTCVIHGLPYVRLNDSHIADMIPSALLFFRREWLRLNAKTLSVP